LSTSKLRGIPAKKKSKNHKVSHESSFVDEIAKHSVVTNKTVAIDLTPIRILMPNEGAQTPATI
jgi:hypothetical protein